MGFIAFNISIHIVRLQKIKQIAVAMSPREQPFTDSEVSRTVRDTNRLSSMQSGKMLIALLFGLLSYSS